MKQKSGTVYPYNICGIKVPGYTSNSTLTRGETLGRYLCNKALTPSLFKVRDPNLKTKNKHIRRQKIHQSHFTLFLLSS